MTKIIQPNWQVPNNIHAFTTTRNGGISPPPFNTLNLGNNTNDSTDNIIKNRKLLMKDYSLPNAILWLTQVHGDTVVNANSYQPFIEADGVIAQQANQVCVILTADCLPIILCNRTGTEVAAIHAGWRNLEKEIISKTINQMDSQAHDLIAWLGPCISAPHFEVGPEVAELLIKNQQDKKAIYQQKKDRYWLSLNQLANSRLQTMGVNQIYDANLCTFDDPSQFFSYRRDKNTGRMATLVWFN